MKRISKERRVREVKGYTEGLLGEDDGNRKRALGKDIPVPVTGQKVIRPMEPLN
jgi:hypothetical protein